MLQELPGASPESTIARTSHLQENRAHKAPGKGTHRASSGLFQRQVSTTGVRRTPGCGWPPLSLDPHHRHHPTPPPIQGLAAGPLEVAVALQKWHPTQKVSFLALGVLVHRVTSRGPRGARNSDGCSPRTLRCFRWGGSQTSPPAHRPPPPPGWWGAHRARRTRSSRCHPPWSRGCRTGRAPRSPAARSASWAPAPTSGRTAWPAASWPPPRAAPRLCTVAGGWLSSPASWISCSPAWSQSRKCRRRTWPPERRSIRCRGRCRTRGTRGGRWGLRCRRRCCSEAPSSALKLSSHRQELERKLQVRTLPPDRSYRKRGSPRFVELQDGKGLQLLPGEVTVSLS